MRTNLVSVALIRFVPTQIRAGKLQLALLARARPADARPSVLSSAAHPAADAALPHGTGAVLAAFLDSPPATNSNGRNT